MNDVPTPLEQTTDRLIQQWLREINYSDDSYGANGYAGEALAITETRNHRSRSRSGRDEVGSTRVHATETRGGRSSKISISMSSIRMEATMSKLLRVNSPAYTAVCLHYAGVSYRNIALELRCSHEYARRYKQSGFDMVLMDVAEFPSEFTT